uniref:Ribosome biogenesis protein YTM1 n=1 Tax=Candidozyma auris TaxID=498019 RepID=A0A0L0NR85_CANAR
MAEDQVKISLFTKEEDELLHVSDAPLYVPSALKRYGLSEIVNHLLGREDDEKKPVPFDFLIDGQLLRTSLKEYLVKNGLSSEAFLRVEYTRAVLPPSFLASFNNEDWVSSVDTINNDSVAMLSIANSHINGPQILSGSYDGIVRTYNMSGQVYKQYVGHLAPVRAVKWIYAHRVVSAGNDRQLRLWKTAADPSVDEIAEDEPESAKTLAILDAHKAPVVSLDVNQKSHRILSAGQDNIVGVWSTNPKDMNTVEPYANSTSLASSASKKRRKMALKDVNVKHRAPLSLLEGHSQPVEGVIFDSTDLTVAYSVSQDHTVKTWDLVTSKCVDTRSTGFSLLSIAQLPQVNLLATGSSARHINLHDPRALSGATELQTTKLLGHTNFVVSLAVCPNNPQMFASGSHDGTVRVWDVRSDQPLYTIKRESGAPQGQNKVFGVAWDKDIGIVSGGEDKKLQINKGNNIA